ncbi:MAG: HEAT repeat domain-containing protein [Candidatus Riflebacteria bacterium]|nr:HEAT repeat domain-containing protein [Candidatus Riflebacteria bacterium]
MLDSLASAENFPSIFAVLAMAFVCLKLAARHGSRRRRRSPGKETLAVASQDLGELITLAERAPSREVQLAAIRSLGERKARQALPVLGRLLASKDPLVASEAADSLGNIGDPAALTYLESAASALEMELSATMDLSAPEPSAAPPFSSSQPAWQKILPPLAKSNYRVFDRFTPHDIRTRPESEILDMLLQLAADPEQQVANRYHALKNLLVFRHPGIGWRVQELLRDEHAMVRYTAAEILAVHGSEECVDALILALRDRNRFVRSSAAMTLAVLASDKAITPLKELAEDGDELVRYSAEKALGSIGRKKRISGLLGLRGR